MIRDFFLDTSVIIEALSKKSSAAFRLVFLPLRRAHTIEYVMKEAHHVLKERGLREDLIREALDGIRGKVIVHRTPPANRFKKLDIRDRSDKPIVYAARHLGCVLVLRDERTYRDALKYVEAFRLDDLQ